jgi:hypothetical protein
VAACDPGAIRDLGGTGPTALPERLEGAAYGRLVGDGRAGARSDEGARMLAILDSLLAGGFDRGDEASAAAVGITSLPGKRYVGYHTGAHWRDLDTDAARLRELGVDVPFLLVEDSELARCRVTGIGEALAAQDVELVRFPIRDPLPPQDGMGGHACCERPAWAPTRPSAASSARRGALTLPDQQAHVRGWPPSR